MNYLRRIIFFVSFSLIAGCSPDPVEKEEDIFHVVCKRLLEYNLRSPSSLEIISLNSYETTPEIEDSGEDFDRILGPNDPGYFVKTGKVLISYDVSNAYGTMIRGRFNCEIGNTLGGWAFISASHNGEKIPPNILNDYSSIIFSDLIIEKTNKILGKE